MSSFFCVICVCVEHKARVTKINLKLELESIECFLSSHVVFVVVVVVILVLIVTPALTRKMPVAKSN